MLFIYPLLKTLYLLNRILLDFMAFYSCLILVYFWMIYIHDFNVFAKSFGESQNATTKAWPLSFRLRIMINKIYSVSAYPKAGACLSMDVVCCPISILFVLNFGTFVILRLFIACKFLLDSLIKAIASLHAKR